ncbi:acyltransferase [Vallitalea pronyensis]|uniref:Acyltransferase n=1 Tax=Vallitalea pronyensis TaxID=1348613 RepID=A0A8J8MKB3_9FIRM|nr:acyltransferase [Vallitalea pronyensis]QUI23002.1 acyltransferase [Vallitalea pronyensis]
MKKFLPTFGLMRIICALSVLGIHVTGQYIHLEFPYLINQFFRYCVPIFIMMSGYFLWYSDMHCKQHTSLTPFYAKQLRKIVIPYVLWLVIYLIYNNRHHLDQLLTLDYIHILLTGYNHLYFLLIIIQLYIIYPFVKKQFNRGNSKHMLIVSGVISLYFQLGIYLYKLGVSIMPYPFIKHVTILFPTWLFYFVFGIYFASHQSKLLKIKPSYVLVVWLVSLIILITDSKLTDTYMYSIKPTVMLYSMLSFYLFYQYFNKPISNGLMRRIHGWSTMSFDFYLSHMLILSLVRSYTKIIGFVSLFNSVGGMLLFYILTIIGTYYFCQLIAVIRHVFSRKRANSITNGPIGTADSYVNVS